jgi:aminoglycoside phosphotransferase (APT) family kinase protein
MSDAQASPDDVHADPSAPPGVNVGSVSEWLAANVDGAVAPFDFEFITGGHSNLTFKVTAGDGRTMVLRRPPLGAVLATAHDMAREHRIISGVGNTSVPVPNAIGLCEDESVNDAPFYVMDYVDGVVLHDDETVHQSIPDTETRSRLSTSVVTVLGDLHLANPDDIGLGDLGRKEAYLDRQLKRWQGQWEKSKTRDLATMERAYELLVEAKPEQRYTGVVHGDYRLGNMLADPAGGTVAAVLDWELCTLGDVLADVGYILNNWVQPGEETMAASTAPPTVAGGFSTREELVDAYAAHTGFEVANINYYRAFQHWRLAAIVEGVMARYLKGVMVDDSVDTDEYRVRVDTMADESLALLATLG